MIPSPEDKKKQGRPLVNRYGLRRRKYRQTTYLS